MPLSGIRLIRQTFTDHLPPGCSLKDATMGYEPPRREGEGQWQVLTFHVIDPGGREHEVKLNGPAREDVYELTVRAAEQFALSMGYGVVGSPKDEPPHGVNKADGG